MFEDQTQEAIQDRTLARVSANLDKREGSLIQTAVGPVSAELAQAYIALEGVLQESFADTQTREFLIRRAAERGLTPIPATNTVVKGEFNLASVGIGSRFACGDFNYVTTAKISDGVYRMTCETAGSAPNGNTGTLLPLVTISGLTSAEITEILVPGIDEEDTEAFRARYFESFQSKAFGGNRADYHEKTMAIPGVGGVKIYRASSVAGDEGTSGGNVRLVILGSDYSVPSAEIVAGVKETLDPEAMSGYGYGLAPIWHHVFVEAATGVDIDLNVTFTYDTGYEYEDLKDAIAAALDAYYLTLSKTWEDNTTGIIVRETYIQNALISIDGIIDAEVNSINGSPGNLVLDVDAVPVRGAITCN